jgi:hypothetical protein
LPPPGSCPIWELLSVKVTKGPVQKKNHKHCNVVLEKNIHSLIYNKKGNCPVQPHPSACT